MKLSTIGIFSHPHEAMEMIERLESEGIKAFISEEHLANVDYNNVNIIGGIKLQVHRSDFDRAVNLIGIFQSQKPDRS